MNELLYSLGNIVNVLSVLFSIGSVGVGVLSWYKVKKKENNEKWKYTGGLAAGGLIVSVIIFMYANSLVEVPTLQGKFYYDAKNILIEHGLDFNTVQGQENGIVTEQAPEAGEKVTKGTKVLMIVEPNTTATNTPVPTATNTPVPTATDTPVPTATNTPVPTATNIPVPTATDTLVPTATNIPVPTATNTPVTTVINTPMPTATNTPVPTATNTPVPTPTSTPTPIPKYKVTFDSNGGSIVTNQTVTYGEILSDFLAPTRDYYRFLGWTYNGQKVTSINVEHDMVLVAAWEPKRESDWIQASHVPTEVRVTDEKWTYTKTETAKSTEPILNGWISNGYRTETVAEGTFEYADFPENFDKSSALYHEMYQGQSGPALTDGVTREILSDNWTGYVYWHYAFPLAEQCDAGNRTVGPAYNTKFTAGYTTIFNAFKSGKNYTTKTNNSGGGGTVYKITDTHTTYEESGGSYWWFRFEYKTCNYIDTRKVYMYYKTTQMESAVEVFPNDEISNITKWVKYIEK